MIDEIDNGIIDRINQLEDDLEDVHKYRKKDVCCFELIRDDIINISDIKDTIDDIHK